MSFKIICTENILNNGTCLKDCLFQHNAFPDSVKVKNKVYVVFRSATEHAPTIHSKIVVLSTIDYQKWNLEKEFISSTTDYRDPKLVYFKGLLHLYWGIVSPTRKSFHQIGILHSTLCLDDSWSEPEFVYKKGYLLSRVREIKSSLYLCVYKWDSDNPFLSETRIISSPDGHFWNEHTEFGVQTEEGTESDCIECDGSLLWIIRKDYATHSTPGSTILLIDRDGKKVKRICSPIKYDSPLLFSNRKQIYLLSRYQLKNNGVYYRGTKFIPNRLCTIGSQCLYWITNKSTALWEINTNDLKISLILDLPSNGDTGYCGIVETKKKFHIFNYSSSLENRKISWRLGQCRPASIYRHELKKQII